MVQSRYREVLRLAEQQFGVFRTDQAVSLGYAERALRRDVDNGRLHLPHPGTFAVAGHPDSPQQRATAAVLACGEGALLSFHSAVASLGLTPDWPTLVHVTLPHDRRIRRLPGVRLHRTRRLESEDRAKTQAIPVTSVERTIIDIAPESTHAYLTMLIDDTCRLGRTTPNALVDRALALHAGGRRGPRLVAHLLLSRPDDAPGHRSALETYVARLLARAGIPPGLANHKVETRTGTFECDMFWPRQRVVLEIDGRHHDRTGQHLFDQDKRRALEDVGCGVLRTDRREVVRYPNRLCNRIRSTLGVGAIP